MNWFGELEDQKAIPSLDRLYRGLHSLEIYIREWARHGVPPKGDGFWRSLDWRGCRRFLNGSFPETRSLPPRVLALRLMKTRPSFGLHVVTLEGLKKLVGTEFVPGEHIML